MNKTELVAAVAEQADISKKDAEKALEEALKDYDGNYLLMLLQKK